MDFKQASDIINKKVLNNISNNIDLDLPKAIFYDEIENCLGETYLLVRLLSDMYMQVYNNGICGYFYNNYHTTGDFKSPDVLLKLLKLTKGTSFNKLLNSVHFEVDDEETIESSCENCDGNGYHGEYDELSNYCDECDGSGLVEVDNDNHGYLTENCQQYYESIQYELLTEIEKMLIDIAKDYE